LAQNNNSIIDFFEKEKSQTYNMCKKRLQQNEDYIYVKSINDTMLISLLEKNCLFTAENFDFFKNNSLNLINSNSQNNIGDFIIINTILRSTSRPNPTLSIMKFKDDDQYFVLHNDSAYDKIKKKSYQITDSSLAGYKPENNFKELETYFYNQKPNKKIFKTFEKAEKKYKNFNTYYIVARISGKIVTKKIYFAGDDNN